MRSIFFSLLILISIGSIAQCKTFRLTSSGDTLNCTDQDNTKRGKWKLHVDPLRGNPGYDEEGEFVNNLREGLWRRYNMMGDLVAIQNYKWGMLDGLSEYYTLAGIERQENWLAMNPEKLYDTLDVEDINDQNKTVQVIYKNDGKSFKHGTWKWYRPGGESIIRSEVYFMNKLQVPTENTDETAVAKKPEPKKVKPKEVMDFEKKNSKKKSYKTKDGSIGL